MLAETADLKLQSVVLVSAQLKQTLTLLWKRIKSEGPLLFFLKKANLRYLLLPPFLTLHSHMPSCLCMIYKYTSLACNGSARMNHHQFHVGGWCQTVLSDRLKVRDSVCAANQGMLSGSPHHPPQAEEKKSDGQKGKKLNTFSAILNKLYVLVIYIRHCNTDVHSSTYQWI